MKNIIVIEDDRELCELLKEFFQAENFELETVHDGLEGLRRVSEGNPDLVILDVMLPGINGFDVLKKIRERSKVPVIMLTARGEDLDRIIGLEMGADDYLPKPFNTRELLARIKAILRRQPEHIPGAPSSETQVIKFGEMTLDLGNRTLHKKD